MFAFFSMPPPLHQFVFEMAHYSDKHSKHIRNKYYVIYTVDLQYYIIKQFGNIRSFVKTVIFLFKKPMNENNFACYICDRYNYCYK